MPKVRVRLFAAFREAVGSKEVELDLPDGARVVDMLKELKARYPKLGEMLKLEGEERTFILMKGGRWPGLDAELADGEEFALFPPVGGG